MSCRVGLVSQRAELIVEVAATVVDAGAELVPIGEELGQVGQQELGSAFATAGRGAPRIDALIVDAAAEAEVLSQLVGRAEPGLEVVVVCREPERHLARDRAREVAAGHVVALPGGRAWLHGWLRHSRRGTPLVGVLGAAGGAGTTTTAIALAAARQTLLMDLDPDGAGLHLPLGLDDTPGLRWSQLPADVQGPLDPESFLAALPRAAGVPVVCGDVPRQTSGPVGSVLLTVRSLVAGAVVDVGRRDHHGALRPDDWLVLVVPATIAGVVAAQRMLAAPPQHVVLAIRDSGLLAAESVMAELGPWPAVRIPRLRRAAELAECGQLLSGRTGRALLRVGSQLAEFVS